MDRKGTWFPDYADPIDRDSLTRGYHLSPSGLVAADMRIDFVLSWRFYLGATQQLVGPPETRMFSSDARRKALDSVAPEFDRFRPGYPPELIDKILNSAGLSADAHILEIRVASCFMSCCAVDIAVCQSEECPNRAPIVIRNC